MATLQERPRLTLCGSLARHRGFGGDGADARAKYDLLTVRFFRDGRLGPCVAAVFSEHPGAGPVGKCGDEHLFHDDCGQAPVLHREDKLDPVVQVPPH